MTVFVDTSGLYAVLDRDDSNHEAAAATWRCLLEEGEPLLTSSYVLVETTALVQHRLGPKATAVLIADVVPLLTVEWVGVEMHAAAVAALLVASRSLSLVDCSSFEVMRRLGLRRAFTFDRHFVRQGFEICP